ncbi:MAG: heavy-metal-associated domain-containing protein [Coriobacteriales bacterium]
MYQSVVTIEGMSCGMCEAHISDVIRSTFPDAKKVKASHRKSQATFRTDYVPDRDTVREAIDKTGYRFVDIVTEERS